MRVRRGTASGLADLRSVLVARSGTQLGASRTAQQGLLRAGHGGDQGGPEDLWGRNGRRVQRQRRRDDEERTRLGLGPGERLPGQPRPPATATARKRERLAKRLAFAAAFVANGGNGEQAALVAGYGATSAARGGRAAHVRAHRLLRDPHVRAMINVEKIRRMVGAGE